METAGKIILAIVCLFMAGLNLWNLFKDWFDERYLRREKQSVTGKSKNKEKVHDIIGKSKFSMDTGKKEAPILSNADAGAGKKNDSFHSVNLEKEAIPLNTAYDKSDAQMSSHQSATVDEFELLARTLSGKAINDAEKAQVGETILKIKGTDLFEQIISRVNGAEDIVVGILDNMQDNRVKQPTVNTGFDFSKYIRK